MLARDLVVEVNAKNTDQTGNNRAAKNGIVVHEQSGHDVAFGSVLADHLRQGRSYLQGTFAVL
jgi:hypothetical protein